MTVRQTQIFDTFTNVYTFLGTLTFPAHPQAGGTPLIVMGGLVGGEAGLEVLAVQTVENEGTSAEFASLNPVALNEAYTIRIFFGTYPKGQSGVNVWARLKAVSQTIETGLRDQVNGQPAGFSTVSTWKWIAGRIVPQLEIGGEGIVGTCEMYLDFEGRI